MGVIVELYLVDETALLNAAGDVDVSMQGSSVAANESPQPNTAYCAAIRRIGEFHDGVPVNALVGWIFRRRWSAMGSAS